MNNCVKNLPLISVITPAYNAAPYIGECIESVVSQTYRNWEMIVVDDGSTDNTKEHVLSYVARDNRIKYFYQPNGRQGKARNLAITKSRGEYLAFIDADDLWLPNKLAVQLECIYKHKVDLVFSDCYVFHNYFDQRTATTLSDYVGVFQGRTAIEAFLDCNQISILTALVKASLVNTAGGFSEKPDIQNAEDYHLWLKLLAEGAKFMRVADILAAYREHSNSVSSKDKFCSLQVISAMEDISVNYPQLTSCIESRYKSWVYRAITSFSGLDRFAFRAHLKKSFALIGYQGYLPLIYSIDSICGRAKATKLAHFILEKF